MGFELDVKRNVLQSYGVRTTNQKYGGNIDDDLVKWAVWTFDYNALPTYGTDNLEFSIPANARIIDARFEVITAFTSTSTTTDLLVGLSTSAGASLGTEAILAATDLTQTTIATAGNVITAAGGTLVGKTIGTTAGELSVTSSAADLLTGRGRVIVRYIKAGI